MEKLAKGLTRRVQIIGKVGLFSGDRSVHSNNKSYLVDTGRNAAKVYCFEVAKVCLLSVHYSSNILDRWKDMLEFHQV